MIKVGMMVAVIHSDDPNYTWLIGQIGTVTQQLSQTQRLLVGSQWAVDLPATKGRPCEHCKKAHKGSVWPFNSHELRPIIDPDDEMPRETEETLDEEITA